MTKVGQLYRETLVKQVKEGVNEHDHMFLLSYSQISGGEMSEFRKSLKSAGARMTAAKNSVAQLALKEVEQENLAGKVTGQTALVWGGADSSEVSKIIIDFMKKSEKLTVQGGLLQGKLLDEGDIKKLSELPSRDVLLSMLLSSIQAPLTRLAGAMNAKTRDLISVLRQLSEKKGGNDNV